MIAFRPGRDIWPFGHEEIAQTLVERQKWHNAPMFDISLTHQRPALLRQDIDEAGPNLQADRALGNAGNAYGHDSQLAQFGLAPYAFTPPAIADAVSADRRAHSIHFSGEIAAGTRNALS